MLNDTKSSNYSVAIYIRLSKEDVDKHLESESVKNQKVLLENYVNDNKYQLYNIYIDDGYTGVNFDRPGFQKMKKDIELNKINMVITKDLSRLGRDYIETGKYIEKYFPMHNVRYVSLLDGIDTSIDDSNNDIAPFKAVINDMYSKDNSKKIRTALHTKQLKGKWVGSCPPLGYMIDSNDKNHLIINDEEATIVKKIFSLANEGNSFYQIRNVLISENIPTASIIRKMHSNTYLANQGIWSTKTIKNILTNQLYVGDMVQNRRQRVNYKIRKIIKNDKSRWIIVNNTHEAIIDRKIFNITQKLLYNCKVRPRKESYRLFDGILYCYDCKGKISICAPRKTDKKTYIVCNKYRMYSKMKLCTSHSNNYDLLEEEILFKIKEIFLKHINQKIINNLKNIYLKSKTTDKEVLTADMINEKINVKKDLMEKMYIEKLENKITQELYNRISFKLNTELKKLDEEKINLILSVTNDKKDIIDDSNVKIKEFINFLNIKRDTILKIVKKIEIHNNKEIDIFFNFSNH